MNYNEMSLDQLLVHWKALDQNLKIIKTNEMELRKLIVTKAFPDAKEGTNTKQLGNGYELKANIKLNYKLSWDISDINSVLNEISKMGNEGYVFAQSLVKQVPALSITAYKQLKDTEIRKKIKTLIDQVLTISNSAPTLELKEPKNEQ